MMNKLSIFSFAAIVAMFSFALVGCGEEAAADEEQEAEIQDVATEGVGGAPEVQEQMEEQGN
jgi:hypothetical protein